MFVLVDMEWVGTEERHLTQLAAMRVDENWEPLETFEAVIRPPEDCFPEPGHMALSGYPLEKFQNAGDQTRAIRRFCRWLRRGDTLCVWHFGAADALEQAWRGVYSRFLPYRVVSAGHPARLAAHDDSDPRKNIYELTEALGLPDISPHHCAKNDVLLIRQLCAFLKLSQDELWKRYSYRGGRTRTDRNQEILRNIEYPYVFAPGSAVFHTRECPRIRAAGEIRGCHTYEKASENRRPCQICRPQKSDEPEPPVLPPGKKLKSLLGKHPDKKRNSYQVVTTRLFGGTLVEVYKDDLVGRCCHKMHAGDMTTNLMYRQGCWSKRCPYFEKYEDSFFWTKKRKRKKK